MFSVNKGSLSLLANYGSDNSSDDEVPGPTVSSKRLRKSDNEESDQEPSLKKFERLPLPEILKNITTAAVDDHVDNPSLHGGKIRTFPHERGNWVTYVYIPFETHDGVKELVDIIITNIPQLQIKETEEMHVSLSRTVILKHHWIESFTTSLKSHTRGFRKFMMLFGNLKIYCNDERTRTFIGFEIKTGYDSLLRLTDIVDNCLQDFNLPTFYKDPSFHISIAWCVGDYEEELNKILSQLNTRLQEVVINHHDENWYIYVEHLFCKSGNKCYAFPLT